MNKQEPPVVGSTANTTADEAARQEGKSLKQSYLLFAAAIIATLAVIITGSYYFLDDLNKSNTKFRQIVDRTRLAQTTFKTQVQEWKNTLLRGNSAKDFKKYSTNMKKSAEDVGAILDNVKKQVADKTLVTRIDDLNGENKKILSAYVQALTNYQSSVKGSAFIVDKSVRGIDRSLNNNFNSVVTDLLAYAGAKSQQLYLEAIILLILISTLGSAAITILLVRNYRSISGPLNLLRDKLVEVIETKNLRADLPNLYFKELNQVGGAATYLLESLRRMIAEMDTVCKGVDDLSANLVHNSDSLKTVSEETALKAGVISSSAEEMNSSVQTIATSIEELSMSVEELSRRTVEASNVSSDAETTTNSTNEIVKELGDKAQQISGITEAISELAKQTNLLALNASIEAANAGEAGKGFDVVAKEVKTLATESSDSTTRIRDQVEGIQSKVEETVASLGKISSVVQNINSITTTLASTIQQQSMATKEISGNTQGMSTASNDVTMNINLIAESSKANLVSIGQISKMAGELNEYSGRLKVLSGAFSV